LIFVALIFAGKAQLVGNASDAVSKQPADIYLGLRGRILSTSPKEMNIDSVNGKPFAYGVVMDLSMDSGTATIVSLSTAEAEEAVITKGKGPWFPLFRDGNEVITQLRLTSPKN
jgi:hypothetical protein